MVTVDYLKTKADYEQALKDNERVVIDFTASWCGPCKRIAPKFLKMAEEFTGIKFFKVDVDDNSETSETENIQAMPTFKFYKDGKVIDGLNIQGADEGSIKKNLGELMTK